MKLLVVGGAGYIGSHMVKLLHESGHQVTVLDNLSQGHRDAVLGAELVVGDLNDAPLLKAMFQATRFAAVMHFASFIQVGESLREPHKYYENNVSNTLNLLNVMREHEVKGFIFSSSAAIYGEPQYVPIDEAHSKVPLNPYGRSKWMVEQVLEDYSRAQQLQSVSLRYFNAAGADPAGRLGERHDPETHLIPLVLRAAMGTPVQVFGRDYATPDGTCIRDYIHVQDLCDAHLLALQYLLDGGATDAFNLGNGDGYSVQEVIHTARTVTGKAILTQDAPRRPGDPARLVADATRAKNELNWRPRRADLEQIISDAWRWENADKF